MAQHHEQRGPVTVVRHGSGPEVLLVHGGASPVTTWSALDALAGHFTLVRMYRRGFAPSPPPPDGRQDFEVDAADIADLLDGRPHVVAHSYGAAGVALAAQRRPQQVRSLTLLEPALDLLRGDAEVDHLKRLAATVLADGPDADPGLLREFLRIAGVRDVGDGPLPPAVSGALGRAVNARSPYEARPDLAALRAAGFPILIASGDHYRAIERVCDALADQVDAHRVVAPGAGHFVAAAPGFAERLDDFLQSAG